MFVHMVYICSGNALRLFLLYLGSYIGKLQIEKNLQKKLAQKCCCRWEDMTRRDQKSLAKQQAMSGSERRVGRKADTSHTIVSA